MILAIILCSMIGFSKSQICALQTIINNINEQSNICTITAINVFSNAPQPSSFPDVINTVAAFGSLLGPQAAIASTFISTFVGLFDDSEEQQQRLNIAFENKVNQAIQDVVDCIDIKIDVNNAEIAAEDANDRLSALTLQFQDLEGVNAFDFSDSHKLIVDALRTFIDEEFRNPESFSGTEFSTFLPVFRAFTNFYSTALTSFLAYTRIDCDQNGDNNNNNDELNCARFDDYVAFGYDDIEQLSFWVETARNFSVNAYTPKGLQSEISPGICITQRRNIGDIDTSGFGHIFRERFGFAIDTIRIDMGGFDVEAYDKNPGAGDFEDPDFLIIEVDVSTNDVRLSCIAQTNYLCTAGYTNGNGAPPGRLPTRTETPTSGCCNGIKSKVISQMNFIETEIDQWTVDFNSKYIQQLQDLKQMLDSI